MNRERYTPEIHAKVEKRLREVAGALGRKYRLSLSDVEELFGIGIDLAAVRWAKWMPSIHLGCDEEEERRPARADFAVYLGAAAAKEMITWIQDRGAAKIPKRDRARLVRTDIGRAVLNAHRYACSDDDIPDQIDEGDEAEEAVDLRLEELAALHVHVTMVLEQERGATVPELIAKHKISGKGVRGGPGPVAARMLAEGRAIIERDATMRQLLGLPAIEPPWLRAPVAAGRELTIRPTEISPSAGDATPARVGEEAGPTSNVEPTGQRGALRRPTVSTTGRAAAQPLRDPLAGRVLVEPATSSATRPGSGPGTATGEGEDRRPVVVPAPSMTTVLRVAWADARWSAGSPASRRSAGLRLPRQAGGCRQPPPASLHFGLTSAQKRRDRAERRPSHCGAGRQFPRAPTGRAALRGEGWHAGSSPAGGSAGRCRASPARAAPS